MGVEAQTRHRKPSDDRRHRRPRASKSNAATINAVAATGQDQVMAAPVAAVECYFRSTSSVGQLRVMLASPGIPFG
jgi:hypothetical protein